MSLTQYYTATTLDGFIADPDHSLAWLFTRRREPGGPLSYDRFITDVCAIAMGSMMFEWILELEFDGKDPSDWRWPYDVPCWVFTHRELPVVPDAPITFTSGDVAAVRELLIGGLTCFLPIGAPCAVPRWHLDAGSKLSSHRARLRDLLWGRWDRPSGSECWRAAW